MYGAVYAVSVGYDASSSPYGGDYWAGVTGSESGGACAPNV